MNLIFIDSNEVIGGIEALFIELAKNLSSKNKIFFIVHNNDITNYDEVIFIISKVFDKSDEEAFEIARKVDTEGKGLCGTYDKEVAEAKIIDVTPSGENDD